MDVSQPVPDDRRQRPAGTRARFWRPADRSHPSPAGALPGLAVQHHRLASLLGLCAAVHRRGPGGDHRLHHAAVGIPAQLLGAPYASDRAPAGSASPRSCGSRAADGQGFRRARRGTDRCALDARRFALLGDRYRPGQEVRLGSPGDHRADRLAAADRRRADRNRLVVAGAGARSHGAEPAGRARRRVCRIRRDDFLPDGILQAAEPAPGACRRDQRSAGAGRRCGQLGQRFWPSRSAWPRSRP